MPLCPDTCSKAEPGRDCASGRRSAWILVLRVYPIALPAQGAPSVGAELATQVGKLGEVCSAENDGSLRVELVNGRGNDRIRAGKNDRSGYRV